MEQSEEQEPGREQKKKSYRRHRRAQRIIEGAMKKLSLKEALQGDTYERLLEKENAHGEAAVIIRSDLPKKKK